MQRFRNHDDAAAALADRLLAEREIDGRLVVLALSSPGAPIAARIARDLGAALDAMAVVRLHVPGRPEVALGVLATGGVRVLRRSVLETYALEDEHIEAEVARARKELQARERAWRGDRPPRRLLGRDVLLVDDAIVTGATMDATALAARAEGARRVVAAVPIGSAEGIALVRLDVDALVVVREVESLASAADAYQVREVYGDVDVHRALADNEVWAGV